MDRAPSDTIFRRSSPVAGIKTLHEAFLHELSDTYDAEHQLLKAMDEMHGMAKHPKVKQGLQQHIAQTKEQVENLDKAFAALGEKPEKVTCKGVKGLVEEFKGAAKEMKTPELLDGLIVDAGVKSEHYEIATYGGLVEKAKLMKHDKVARLLEENLKMEELFEQQLHQVEKQLGQEMSKKPELVGHPI
jgi:ferritin-like metal-binding protein YciE